MPFENMKKTHLSESKPFPLGVLDCGEGKRKKESERRDFFSKDWDGLELNC